MPRTNKPRRFDPRCGVSREMLAAEAGHVARELESYLRMSPAELRSNDKERTAVCRQSCTELRDRLAPLPEPERLALRCLLVRDVYHLLELYLTHLRTVPAGAKVPPADGGGTEGGAGQARAPLPFCEWLFGNGST